MGLFGKDQNLAAQLEAQGARIVELEGQLAAAMQATVDANARIDELTKTADSAKALATSQDEALRAASARADAAEAEAADLKKKLANPPDAYRHASEGRQAAVPEGGAAAEGDGPATWAEAVKTCGNDYVAARRKYPEIHKALLAGAREKQTA